MDDSLSRVTVSITDGVADVRLNRPHKHNALDPAMFDAVIDAGERVAGNRAIRAVVLSGAGPSFCAGLDFASFTEMTTGNHSLPADDPDITGPAKARGQRAAHVWTRVPAPVIAAIHGVAFGGGLQIALGADIRIAAPDARLSVLEVQWGLIPDMTGTQVLPDLIGRDRAKELTFTGRVVDGVEAEHIRLVTQTDPNPRDAALALAKQIARNSPDAVRASKQLLDLAGHVPFSEGLAAEQVAIRELIGSPNQREAVQARFGRRVPDFAD
ncbi:crotonase/enoyl-CoA hydratase family protein [Rhodococcus opacus]|uniref:crotonase/enoyl-CoA hydratase family protein n=1 Tax=Rhodococcus opacus TaxID=37919 RepID=UPI001C439B0C|nr:crotonase/enoyl-CoA hydratase family protein [Rhodococcus opacus]MBV6754888.1 crotonase/enoyl-CoA hydratase family protein [Rhodococcus opacus]